MLLYGVECCPMLTRDKRSLEFTVTRSFMKLFWTGSATVVNDCQKFFSLLPLTYQIDIRTTRFLEQFKLYDNCICSLFARQVESNIKKIYASYSDNITRRMAIANKTCVSGKN